MKKTVITAALAFVGGAATAAVTADYSYTQADFSSGTTAQTFTLPSGSDNYTNISNGNQQFTMTLVLDWSVLNGLAGPATYRTAELSHNGTASTEISLGVRKESNGSVVMKMAQNENDLLSATLTDTYIRNGLVTVTLTVDTNGGINRFRMLVLNKEENGTDWVATAATRSDNASSASTDHRGADELNRLFLNGTTKSAIKALYISDSNTSDLAGLAESAYTTAAVPESATATLSLLALAGLATRRRCK